MSPRGRVIIGFALLTCPLGCRTTAPGESTGNKESSAGKSATQVGHRTLSTGTRPTRVFHWTQDDKALKDPGTYVTNSLAGAAESNTRFAGRDFPEDAPAGFGFVAGGDPLILSGDSGILVSVAVKAGAQVVSPSKTSEAGRARGKGYWTSLRTLALGGFPALHHHWENGTGLVSEHALTVRDASLLDLTSARAFDGREVRSFATHSPLPSAGDAWERVFSTYADQTQFMRDYAEAGGAGYRDAKGKVSDNAVVAAIFSEMYHGLPAVKAGFQTLEASENAQATIPRCKDGMSNARVTGLVGNLAGHTSCKLEVRRALETGLQANDKSQLRFMDETMEAAYLPEAVTILKATGYLAPGDKPGSFGEMATRVVARWKEAGGEAKLAELLTGLEAMKAEFEGWSMEKWAQTESTSSIVGFSGTL